MPSKSKAQQRLMAAAEHGADFPMAQKIRASMTHQQMHDFAVGSEKGKPEHVKSAPHPHKNLGGYLHPAKGKEPDTVSHSYDFRTHRGGRRGRA